MKRKVYTYRSISALSEHPCYAELVAYPHITATADLFSAMRKQYPQIRNLVDIHALQKEIIANWEDPDVAFQQFINISRVVRLLPVEKEEQVIHGSFIKNKVQVLNAIRLLTEADVYPDDIAPTNIEERIFKRVWETLDIEDPSFCDLRVTLAAYLDEPAKFKEVLDSIAPCMKVDTIVLHGFYFITPIQERIFDMLENIGKELVFLCCIDADVPEVGEIWELALSKDNGFESRACWIGDTKREMLNKAFGSIFGTDPQITTQKHVSVIKYDSELDFVRDVERIRENGMSIFSADVKATDDLLKEFYPEVYQRRHLLAYPVGQYIYRLHSMWSTKDQCLTLSVDDIQACFASGWVVLDGVNAKKHVHGVEYLSTYVSDCRTIDEWENRLALLRETKDNVLAAFEAHVDEMPEANRRWHRLMADPFTNFSCFSYDNESLQELIDMIRHLIATAKTLFAGPGEVSIAVHMSKLKRLLESGKREEELLAEERVIIEALVSRLRHPNLGVSKCLPGEISQAIILLIGGGILDEDNYSVQAGRDQTFVKPLYQVESAPIVSGGRVHLCFADETRLPGHTKPYVWPVNNDFLDRLLVSTEERRYRYLQDMRSVIDNAPVANRYLFYSLLQNERVEISWISTDEEKEIAASPYVQILEKLFGVEVSLPEKRIWTAEKVADIKAVTVDKSFGAGLEEESALEAKLDMALCPRRYLYGYLLSEHPAFSSDFHYNFALSNLIGVLAKVAGISKQEASEAVLELFPYLRPVEKQQIIDYVPSISYEDTDAMDGASYPQARLLIHFLQRRIKEKAENLLGEHMQAGDATVTLDVDSEYEVCKYCPYSGTCPRAVHFE